MDSGFSPLNVPPGTSGMEKDKDNVTPWFKRWYVWVLPALVLIGVIVANISR